MLACRYRIARRTGKGALSGRDAGAPKRPELAASCSVSPRRMEDCRWKSGVASVGPCRRSGTACPRVGSRTAMPSPAAPHRPPARQSRHVNSRTLTRTTGATLATESDRSLVKTRVRVSAHLARVYCHFVPAEPYVRRVRWGGMRKECVNTLQSIIASKQASKLSGGQ